MNMRQLLISGLAGLLVSAAASAQDAATETPADPTPQSIAVEMFGAANTAMQAGDHETARRLLEAALDLKPDHPAILRGLLTVALRAERPDDAFHALERMAAAGIAFDPENAAELLNRSDAARFAEVRARLAANAEPVGSARIAASVTRPDALIEGVAVDIETDRLFLSSVTGREILMLEPFARNRPEVFADREDGLQSVFGLAVDDRLRLVWAASGHVPQTPLGEDEEPQTGLFAFDLMTGDPYDSYMIEGAGQIADLVVRDGMVYASDSRVPRVYVLRDPGAELEVLSEDPRFVNLQGVALSRGALYVADYAMGIWRIDLGDGSASLLRAGSESLIGIDGLLNTRDGRLVAVRNGVSPQQVMIIDLAPDGRSVAGTEVLLRGHAAMTGNTEPTLIDLADGRAWLVANAAWPLFPEDGSEPETERPATVILEMDVP